MPMMCCVCGGSDGCMMMMLLVCVAKKGGVPKIGEGLRLICYVNYSFKASRRRRG